MSERVVDQLPAVVRTLLPRAAPVEVLGKQLELDQVPELYNPTGTAEGQEDRADDPGPTWARHVERP